MVYVEDGAVSGAQILRHSLVIGKSGSGKTTYARALARTMTKGGFRVLYFSPKPAEADPFPCYRRFNDLGKLLDVALVNSRCAIFIDDAQAYLTYHKEALKYQKFVTDFRGSPWQHIVVIMAQKLRSIANVFRENVAHIYAFRCGNGTAAALAGEYEDDGFLRVSSNDFPPYNFMYKPLNPDKTGRLLPASQHVSKK